jgi:hypothetical protein
MPQVSPPTWTSEELDEQRKLSIDAFARERVGEPLEQYLGLFQDAREAIETIIELSVDLTQIRQRAADVLGDEQLADVCRYLASPPISKDDLETIAQVTMAPTLLRADPSRADALMDVILLGLDRERFPWVSEDRDPTGAELETAIVSTAAMYAMRKHETLRRTQGKNQQEQRVKNFLAEECGFIEVKTRLIDNLARSPEAGHFCGECQVGSRKADIVARLWDGRVMPIECKVSNSATNSYKRINNDAAVKARQWRIEFGDVNIVPAAVLSGVFALNNLTYAQQNGLAILWAHDLAPLRNFIEATKPV